MQCSPPKIATASPTPNGLVHKPIHKEMIIIEVLS